MNNNARVFLIDDDAGMRKSLVRLMESASLSHKLYTTADEFLDDYRSDQPGVIVLDLQMPGMHGMELLRSLRTQGIRLPIIIVTGTGTIRAAVESMRLGVVDFLEKPVDPQVLVQRIHQAIARDAAQRAELAEIQALRQRFEQLTEREREVRDLIVAGMANKTIAAELGISVRTVAIHRANLMEKIGAGNTADLVRMTMIATKTAHPVS